MAERICQHGTACFCVGAISSSRIRSPASSFNAHQDGIIAALARRTFVLTKLLRRTARLNASTAAPRPLQHRKSDRVLRDGAGLAALFGDHIALVVDLFQMAGLEHLRHRLRHVEIAQAVVLIGQLIDFLQVDRVRDARQDKQQQNLHIQHIVNKAVALHKYFPLHFFSL